VLVNLEGPDGAPEEFDTILEGDVVEVLTDLVAANG
jgi:hypothetical protein